MIMGDNCEGTLPMEKLELLSATAILKHGIDGATITAPASKAPSTDKGSHIVKTPSFGQSTMQQSVPSPCSSSVTSTISKPIFSVASTSSVPGLLMQAQESSPAVQFAACKNSSHLASPVSTDGDEEGQNITGNSRSKDFTIATDSASKASNTAPFAGTLATSISTHSLQQMIESRSPVPTVDFRQNVMDGPSPPPASYGYSLHPRYEAAFRPPSFESSTFTTIGGATMSNFPHAPPLATGGGMMYFHHQQQRQLPSPYPHASEHKVANNSNTEQPQQPPTYEEMARELSFVRNQLKEKDMVVSSLQHRVDFLENQINELRQLPTGKITHIPIDDMIRIMQEYGSEVSNQTLPKRKHTIKKTSIVRQFRRWNPEFFRYFSHINGEWVPKLGREGEMRRRAEKRRQMKQQGKNVGSS